MPLQHYLPATYLAFFSKESNPIRRERVLCVGNRDTGNIFYSKAASICAINNIYETTIENLNLSIDPNWEYFERELVFAIDLLENKNLSGLAWANVLVPFVTSLLIRGPDFERRFNRRIDKLIHSDQYVNINIARTFEFQRLLSIVATAKWSVFKTSGNPPLISNDLGYIPSINTDNGERGISIPFGNKNIILNIVPKLKRVIVKAVKGNWMPIIQYIPYKINNTTSFNFSVGDYAQHFIFGEDNILIRNNLREKEHGLLPMEPNQLGFSVQFGRSHEMTWYKIIDFLNKVSTKECSYAYIDLQSIPNGPFMILSPISHTPIFR